MAREYRIVRDDYNGFEVQSRCVWWPFWRQGITNSHTSIESAEAYAARLFGPKPPKQTRVVKVLGRIPHQPTAQPEERET